MIGGIQAAGSATSLYGSYKSGQAKKKAAKARMKMLQEGLKQFKAGSLDALGNKLSADNNGLWSYNLSNSGKAAKNAASKGLYSLANFNDKSRAEIMRDTLNNTHLANTLTARANQAAAMRSGARTNSNLGKISSSYARQGSQNLRNAYLQGLQNAKNSAAYNANIRNNLATAAYNSMAPINSIQNNLQNMVNNLNKSVMNQYNTMAGAAANPYLHGQTTADLFKGIGGMTSGYAQNQQQQQNFEKYLDLLMQMNG